MATYFTSDLSRRSGDIIAEVLRRPTTIVRRNKPRLVLLNIEDYRSLVARADARASETVETMPIPCSKGFAARSMPMSGMARRGELCGTRHLRRHSLPLPLVASGRARRDEGSQVAAGRGWRPVVPPWGRRPHFAVSYDEPETATVTLHGRNTGNREAARRTGGGCHFADGGTTGLDLDHTKLPGAQREPDGTIATESVHPASRRSTTRPSPRTLASITNPAPGSSRAGPSSNEPVRKLSGVLSSTNELTIDAAIR
jgi:hypothetical protein